MTCWLKNVPEWTVLFIRLIIICYFVELQYLSYTNAVRSVGFIKNMSKWELIINLLPIFLTYILFICSSFHITYFFDGKHFVLCKKIL